MNQPTAHEIMKSLVPITRFNKGEANKIFEEVEKNGTIIVIKNNKPACVLMSPSQYESLMEMLSDKILLDEANKRMSANNNDENVSFADVLSEVGITEKDLDNVDVEIE